MLRRLLTVVVPLLVALFIALGVPLAANLAQRETESRYLDRLGDAERFATLTDDALRRDRTASLGGTALAAELRRYDDLYGIAVAVYAVDGRLLVASRTDFEPSTPGVQTGLATARAGLRPDRIGTVWPWRPGPMVVVEPVGRDSGVTAAVVVVSPPARCARPSCVTGRCSARSVSRHSCSRWPSRSHCPAGCSVRCTTWITRPPRSPPAGSTPGR